MNWTTGLTLIVREPMPLQAPSISPAKPRQPDAAPKPFAPCRHVRMRKAIGVDAAISAVLSATREHWTRNVAGLLDGRDPEAIHQFRVGLRRFRSALRLFKSRLEPEQRTWLNREAKWILTSCSLVRDLDVLTRDLISAADGSQGDPDFAALRATAEAARATALGAALRAVQSARYRRFMIRLDMWLDGAGWRTPDRPHDRAVTLVASTLSRRLAKLAARGASLDQMSATERHDIRIAVKKCRYGIEFFRDHLPKSMARKIASSLKAIQDGLGHSNDVYTASHLIEALTAARLKPGAAKAVARAGRKLIAHHRRLDRRARAETACYWADLRRAVAKLRIRF